MRTTLLDAAAQSTLDRYGFVVIPFLGPDEVSDLLAVHREIGRSADDPGRALFFGFHSSSYEQKRAVADAIEQRIGHHLDAVFDRHTSYLTMFITKWPGPDSGFGPHQDPTLVDERHVRGVAIWIPLVDVGAGEVDNGMLYVVPGSHRFVQAARVRDVNESVFAPHEQAILEEFGRGIPMRAGEGIVFDDRLIHYSLPNSSDQPRPVVTFALRPSEQSCVFLRDDGAGGIDQYEIEDERFLDILPSAQHHWVPDSEPTAKLDPPTVQLTADEFAELCRSVGDAPRATVVPAITVPGSIKVDPGLFCAYCGSTDGIDPVDRSGHGKAQLMCRSCEATRGSPDALRHRGQPLDATTRRGWRRLLPTARSER